MMHRNCFFLSAAGQPIQNEPGTKQYLPMACAVFARTGKRPAPDSDGCLFALPLVIALCSGCSDVPKSGRAQKLVPRTIQEF
eukprot:7391213-Prymnesium_polylepis.1